MSEKIYAFLLRLYPSSFQKTYREEALQLFRDRTRDERGFLSALRLWLDLLGDLALSLPREWESVSAASVTCQAQPLWDGTPSFHTLDGEALSPRSMAYGGMAALLVYSSIMVLVGYGGKSLPIAPPDALRTQRSFKSIPTRPPTITLSYLPASPAPGSILHLTATVHAVGGETPTGSVRFFDGTTVLNIGELNNGTVTIKAKLPHIARHTLRATYLGDAEYSPASSVSEQK
jgi:hypothetical protein